MSVKTEKSLVMNREILRLAIPNIISNISVPLLSTADVIFMGGLSGLHIGAVGIGGMLFSFLFWNFGFLRMGTTGMSAQSFGRQDYKEINRLLQRAAGVAIGIGILLLLLSPLIWKSGAYLMNVSEEQYDMVRTYFFIMITSAPATLLLFALKGWFFGLQNAFLPLVLTMFVNIVNIGLSFYFVVISDFEIAGVAWGTVIAQYLGCILAILMALRVYKHFITPVSWSVLFKKEAFSGFFNVNKDIFIRTLCLSLTFGFFYSKSSAHGELLLAANVILMQLLNWMSYGIDGFAYAAESLVGKYFGANDKNRIRRSVNLSIIWGLVLAVFYSALYGLLSRPILELFTDEPEVVNMAMVYILWMAVLPLAGFGSYIWDGIFIGITATKAMRNTMFLALVVFLGAYYLGSAWIGPNHGLWLALLMFLAGRGLFQWVWYKYFWVKKNLIAF